jgi:hypothetical protein
MHWLQINIHQLEVLSGSPFEDTQDMFESCQVKSRDSRKKKSDHNTVLDSSAVN